MKLVVVSHKECWADSVSSTGYGTIGGFPFQMNAISELFWKTTLLIPLHDKPLPSGAIPLTGHNVSVRPLDMPAGRKLRRKIALLFWLPSNFPIIWRAIRNANAVHTPVPGDIGTIGILVAIAQRKPLFVRHCGTWGNKTTMTDRFLLSLLPRIASGRNVVMATGGGENPPCPKKHEISWIFASSISESEWFSIPRPESWKRGNALKLVTVSRLDPGKNTEAVIKTLPLLRKDCPKIILNIVGDGPCLETLKKLAESLGLSDSVNFHGRLDHKSVMKVLCGSDLFVFPTRVKEGFPKVVLEAFACGLPVIATSVSVIPYLIGKDKGVVLKDTDHNTVAEAIIQIISDEGRLAQMSSNAREASRQYTLERWQQIIGERLTKAWGPLKQKDQ